MSDERLRKFEIQPQPTDDTCGPTCLHAIYNFFGDDLSFDDVEAEVPSLHTGGTLGVLLALSALRRGYRVTLRSWNLQVVDPTWFLPGVSLEDKLRQRAALHGDPKVVRACEAYATFVAEGGQVELCDLHADILRDTLNAGVPILVGLSASYLYHEARAHDDGTPDDVAGDPVGHFVVLTGFRQEDEHVLVSDPLYPNPYAAEHTYAVPIKRLLGAIFLGVLTHDGNLITITPPQD